MQSSAYMLMFNLKKHERFCVLVNGYIVFMTCMSINGYLQTAIRFY